MIWTIWEYINNLIFKDQVPSLEKAEDDARFRVAWWFKHYGKGSKLPVSLLILNVKESCVILAPLKKKLKGRWMPPVGDNLKFNVDGSANGNPGSAGIGGVLRDANGRILCQFSLAAGIQDAITAEILAIRKACELCAIKPSLSDRNIHIASDSSVAVSWVNSVDNFGSLTHVNAVLDIRSYLQSQKGLSLVFNPRETNEMADGLAKSGAHGGEDCIVWGGF